MRTLLIGAAVVLTLALIASHTPRVLPTPNAVAGTQADAAGGGDAATQPRHPMPRLDS